MKYKKYRVKKEHIYPEKLKLNRQAQKAFEEGYVFFQGIYDDYYMIVLKEYKTKPSMIECELVELEVVEGQG